MLPNKVHIYAVVCILLAFLNASQSAVLIADYSMSRMIELIARKPFCKLHTDR